MSSFNYELLKQHYQEMNKQLFELREVFKDNVISIVVHLLDDIELVQMGKNFIGDLPVGFYTDVDFLLLVECLLESKRQIGRLLFLSTRESRENFIKENSEFIENNQEAVKSYLDDGLTMFAHVLIERVPEADIYAAYVFIYNIVIEYLAEKWKKEYGQYFLDVSELSLDSAIERYCSIETLAHQNIISAGTFVNYLIQQGKFEQGNRNYFDCLNIFVPMFNKIMEGKKYKNFVDKLKTIKSEKQYTVDEIDLMNGPEFENFIAKLFSEMGYETEVTKASGDQGIDVIVSKNGNKIGIQAKCYSGTVGNSAIQEAVAGIKFYHLDKAMVVTNNFFTASAQQLALVNSIVLWDRYTLREKIDEIFNSRSG